MKIKPKWFVANDKFVDNRTISTSRRRRTKITTTVNNNNNNSNNSNNTLPAVVAFNEFAVADLLLERRCASFLSDALRRCRLLWSYVARRLNRDVQDGHLKGEEGEEEEDEG